MSLWIAGMDGWQALIHAFTVTGLGGFSSKDASLGYFDSVPVDLKASNYQGLSDFQTWVLAFTMILGRLEIFTLLVVMTPVFWRR